MNLRIDSRGQKKHKNWHTRLLKPYSLTYK